MMGKRLDNEALEARRDEVRRHLRRGLRPRQILQLMSEHYSGYKNPYRTLVKDIQAVRQEDARAARLIQPDEALADYIGKLEQLYEQAVLDSLRLEGTARVGALNTAKELAKDLARAAGVDRRILGEGKDLTVRPGEGENGESFEAFVLRARRERGLDGDGGQAG